LEFLLVAALYAAEIEPLFLRHPTKPRAIGSAARQTRFEQSSTY
jgi:hypothetical protein